MRFGIAIPGGNGANLIASEKPQTRISTAGRRDPIQLSHRFLRQR